MPRRHVKNYFSIHLTNEAEHDVYYIYNINLVSATFIDITPGDMNKVDIYRKKESFYVIDFLE